MLLIVLITISCKDVTAHKNNTATLEKLQLENDSLKQIVNDIPPVSNNQISTFFTFQDNNAEEAMNFYVELFGNSKITDIQRYGKDGPAKEGSILIAKFQLNGQQYACSDSYIKHAWTFTPGISNFVACKTNEELEHLFAKLSENGTIVMPLNNYGFSKRFGFVEDRFGISWQLNLQYTIKPDRINQ